MAKNRKKSYFFNLAFSEFKEKQGKIKRKNRLKKKKKKKKNMLLKHTAQAINFLKPFFLLLLTKKIINEKNVPLISANVVNL